MKQYKTSKIRSEKTTATTVRESVKKRLETYILSQTYPPKEVDVVSAAISQYLDKRGV